MTQLTGDAGKVFPPDFASLVPKDVVRKVRELFCYVGASPVFGDHIADRGLSLCVMQAFQVIFKNL